MGRRSVVSTVPEDAAQRHLLERDQVRHDASALLYQLVDMELRALGYPGVSDYGSRADDRQYDVVGPKLPPTKPSAGRVEPSSLVEDEFTSVMLETLAFEALSHEPLLPLNWKVGRPRLNLTAHIDRNGVFSLGAAPPFEHRLASAGGGFAVEDFSRYPLRGGAPGEEVLKLNLPALLDDEAVAPKRRKLLYGLYEFVVRSLVQHFECRVLSGLVCFGPENELAVRDFQPRDNEVERADLLGHDTTQWHPDIHKLCAAVKLTPGQALQFFRESLKALPVDERERAWLGFCGTKHRGYGYGSQAHGDFSVHEILAVLDDPEKLPPFTGQNFDAGAVIDRFLEGVKPEDAISALAKHYRVNVDYTWRTVAQLRPKLYASLPRRPRELVAHLTPATEDGGDTVQAREALEEALLRWARCEWGTLSTRWDMRLRDIASTLGFKLPELKTWAAANAPKLAQWMLDAQARCQAPSTASARRSQGAPTAKP